MFSRQDLSRSVTMDARSSPQSSSCVFYDIGFIRLNPDLSSLVCLRVPVSYVFPVPRLGKRDCEAERYPRLSSADLPVAR